MGYAVLTREFTLNIGPPSGAVSDPYSNFVVRMSAVLSLSRDRDSSTYLVKC